MAKSKREVAPIIEHSRYCSGCNKDKTTRYFYKSNSPKFDNNTYWGHTPLCKKCLKDKIYRKDGQIDKGIFIESLKTDFDMPFFNEKYLQAFNSGKEVVGEYLRLLNLNNKKVKMTWEDGETEKKEELEKVINEDNLKITKEMIMSWGKGFNYDEYEFLDNELFEWEKTYKYGKRAELVLLKEICTTLLKIRETREKNEDVSKLQKDLQDLLKTASIDPAKANIADNGKSLDAFGVWIKDIESKRPAEWFEEQDKYKDIDGFVPYIKNYIIRPIRNFLSGNRDFQINDGIDIDLDNVDVKQNDEGDNNEQL